jgi:uncharacterized protein (TIGR03086 family)
MKQLLERVAPDQLDAPTPCPDYRLGDLIEHIGGLAAAFTAAARKAGGAIVEQGGAGDVTRLPPDWRARIPADLDTLAAAWREPASWTGMTRVGGVDLPGEIAGMVALDEIVLHGWDVARATGQPYAATADEIETCQGFVAQSAAPGQEEARRGIFGPVVAVPADAPAMDRLVGLSGRDPKWSQPPS